ncbi:MAG: hypothetical protein ACRDV3_15960 [Acidothermaceae bacterium]
MSRHPRLAAVVRTESVLVAAITLVGCASHGSAYSAVGRSGGLTSAQRALAVRISQTEAWGSRPSDPGVYPTGVDPSAPGTWPDDVQDASVMLTTHADAMQYVGGGSEAGDGSTPVLVIRLIGDFSWITSGPPGSGPATGNVATIVVEATTGQVADTGLERSNQPASLPGATKLYMGPVVPDAIGASTASAPAATIPMPTPSPVVSPPVLASSPAPQVAAVSTPPSVVVGPTCAAAQLTADLEDVEFAADFGGQLLRQMHAGSRLSSCG